MLPLCYCSESVGHSEQQNISVNYGTNKCDYNKLKSDQIQNCFLFYKSSFLKIPLNIFEKILIDFCFNCIKQGWPSFLCKAPTLLPTRVGCAINVGQGWPTFSVHAPKFFATQTFTSRCATQTFISFHCLQTCSGVFIL